MIYKPVSLRGIIEELSMLPDETYVYLDRETGVFVAITESQFNAAQDDQSLDEHADWEREIIILAREVEHSDRYVALPDKYDLNEYQIMRRFCHNVIDGDIRDELLRAIAGKGAFRMFRDAVRRHDLDEAWYAYRDGELADVARSWLRDKGISFIEDIGVKETRDT